MQRRKPRVVFDTNIWVSFLISRKLAKIETQLNEKKITLLFSDELLTEFIEVTQRRKIKKYLETDEVLDAINILQKHAERVQVTSEVNECEDPDDNFLLALCKDGNANYLVTGDKLLLRIKRFHSTEVISLRSYFEGTT